MFHHAMREEYLKPTPLKPYMTYADHLVWPIHVPRRCEPLITPHLSLRGNSRTRATFPTHKKSHNPHPQGERGKGFNMGTLHCGGGGGGACQTWIIYIYIPPVLNSFFCTFFFRAFLVLWMFFVTWENPQPPGVPIIQVQGPGPALFSGAALGAASGYHIWMFP